MHLWDSNDWQLRSALIPDYIRVYIS